MPVFRVPATITYPGKGAPGANVWSIRTTEGSVIQDELELALGQLQAFYQYMSDCYAGSTVVTLGEDIVNRETGEDESRPTRTINLGASSAPAPQALSVVVGWKSTLRRRAGQGRTFLGPLAIGYIESDGTPSGLHLNHAKEAATALLAASDTANGWAIGIWGLETSPGAYDSSGNLVPGQPHVHRDATSFSIRDNFAVLRSRRD